MCTLALATMDDLALCNEIINIGRAFQKEQGFLQWTENYPNIDTLRDDIAQRKGYVLKIGGEIAGYLCIDFGGEAAYNAIRGAWNTPEPYAVVHRLAIHDRFRGRGLASAAFGLIEQLCAEKQIGAIRIDTGLSNYRMQHILEKSGFRRCGLVTVQGGDRIAYDKRLPSEDGKKLLDPPCFDGKTMI